MLSNASLPTKNHEPSCPFKVNYNHFIYYLKIILYGIISCHHNIIHSLYKLGCQCLFCTITCFYSFMDCVGLPIVGAIVLCRSQRSGSAGPRLWMAVLRGPGTSVVASLAIAYDIVGTRMQSHL